MNRWGGILAIRPIIDNRTPNWTHLSLIKKNISTLACLTHGILVLNFFHNLYLCEKYSARLDTQIRFMDKPFKMQLIFPPRFGAIRIRSQRWCEAIGERSSLEQAMLFSHWCLRSERSLIFYISLSGKFDETTLQRILIVLMVINNECYGNQTGKVLAELKTHPNKLCKLCSWLKTYELREMVRCRSGTSYALWRSHQQKLITSRFIYIW